MKPIRLTTIMFVGVMLASGSALAGDAYVDADAGLIVDDSALALATPDLKGPPSGDCTLIVPAIVSRGEVFTATVAYDPPAPGGARTEDFEFEWPSTFAGFSEKTERQKAWDDVIPNVIASFESVVVPTAGAISGSFEAQVKVRGDYKCKANAWMTVLP